MFLEHVRLSPCASLNKSGCIKGSGRSKIDILHLPTKMLKGQQLIGELYSIPYSNIRTDNECTPNTGEEYLGVGDLSLP